MKKLKLNHRKTVTAVIIVSACLLVAIQVFIDLCVVRSLLVRGGAGDNGVVITSLIGDAVNNLNKPAPVDPASGKVYIPEAHLVLPAYTGIGQVEYWYENGQYTSNNATEIHLTSTQIMNLAINKLWVDVANANNRQAWQTFDDSKVFNSVPSLQACARGVQIFYSKQSQLDGDYIYLGSHKLNDGRTLYVYSENQCQQDQTTIISLAKQAQSY